MAPALKPGKGQSISATRDSDALAGLTILASAAAASSQPKKPTPQKKLREGQIEPDPRTANALAELPASAAECASQPVMGTLQEEISQGHLRGETHVVRALADLRTYAEMYWDQMKQRVSVENQIRSASIESDVVTEHIAGLILLEKGLKRALAMEYRRAVAPEVRAWQEQTVGLGEHTMARLIGHLGHPRHATPYTAVGKGAARKLVALPPYERTVSQLWSYCGVGDATRKRRKGMTVEEAMAAGSPHLRSLLHVIAEGCMKNRQSPYRVVYENRRLVTATRDGWTAGHQHADALRIVAKEILRDLWIASDAEGPALGRNPRTTRPSAP